MGQLNFKDVFQSLFQKERRITYQSLTSNKKHSRIVTIPRKFQSYGDKIVVWDVELDTWLVIQIDTIISIDDV